MFTLDYDYDLPLLQDSVIKNNTKFKRIYVISANHGIAQIYPANSNIGPPPTLYECNLRTLHLSSMMVQLGLGKTALRLGSNNNSDRVNRLPLLGKYLPRPLIYKYNLS